MPKKLKNLLKNPWTWLRRLVNKPKDWYQASKQWFQPHTKALKDWWQGHLKDLLKDLSKNHRSIADAMARWCWRQVDRFLGKPTFKICYFFSHEFDYSQEPTYKEYLYEEYKKWWRRNIWDIKVPLLFLGFVIGMGIWIGCGIWEDWKLKNEKTRDEFLQVIFPLIVAAGFFIQAIFAQIRETWKQKENERRIIWGCFHELVGTNLGFTELIMSCHDVGNANLGKIATSILHLKIERIYKDYKNYKDQPNNQSRFYKIDEFIYSPPEAWDAKIQSIQNQGTSMVSAKLMIEKYVGSRFNKQLHCKVPSFDMREPVRKAAIDAVENAKSKFRKMKMEDIGKESNTAISTIISFHERSLKKSTHDNMFAEPHITQGSSFTAFSTLEYLNRNINDALQAYLNIIARVPITYNIYNIIHVKYKLFRFHCEDWARKEKRIKEEITKEFRLKKELRKNGSKT